MANVVQLSDGTTTLTLSSGDFMVRRHPVQAPAPQTVAALGGSGEQANTPYDLGDVTETLELLIQGSDVADVQSNVRAIQTLLEVGQRRQNTGMGNRLFLIVQLAGEASAWRSEILSARLVLDDASDQLARLKVEGALIVTRRFFWEANTETQLSMSSSETTTPATTVVLYNNDDATAAATNYIHIASTQVTGVLPAPLRLRITNAEVSAVGWQDFYIANTVFCDPSNFDPFLLGSEAAGGATFNWATNSDEVAFRWSLSDARLTDLAGQYVRIVVAFADASNNVYLRPEIQATTLQIPLYVGKQVLCNAGELFDIGSVPIPPGGHNLLGTDLDLVIRAQLIGGGTLVCDFAQLTPGGRGVFTRWTQLGFQTASGEGIEDNGPEGTIYYFDGSRRWPIVRKYGGPVYVWPNRTNRLRVLFRTSNWDSGAVGKKMNAIAYYRPRRLDV
jgi:hypothetical protein